MFSWYGILVSTPICWLELFALVVVLRSHVYITLYLIQNKASNLPSSELLYFKRLDRYNINIYLINLNALI